MAAADRTLSRARAATGLMAAALAGAPLYKKPILA
jgi:hypothetical protein